MSKRADDEYDARWLAHMMRLGILPKGFIYPRAERPLPDLLRKRVALVQQKTANILSIQNLPFATDGSRSSRHGIRPPILTTPANG